MNAMRTALEQIITMSERALGLDPSSMDNYFVWIQDKARAALAQSEAQPLTDAQIDDLWIQRDCIEAIQQGDIIGQVRSFARAIERAVRVRDART